MRQTWLSPRALGLHATVLVVVPGFLWLGWWQLHRALGGNGLSWAYTFEWPFFALYAIFMWWRLVHDVAADRRAANGEGPTSSRGTPVALQATPARRLATKLTPWPARPRVESSKGSARAAHRAKALEAEAEELAAYNSYLASLNEARGRAER